MGRSDLRTNAPSIRDTLLTELFFAAPDEASDFGGGSHSDVAALEFGAADGWVAAADPHFSWGEVVEEPAEVAGL